ncbi:MAG: hypothetical protein KatS3mg110_0321 [Pirellulaceae bacterium]|nr:MAG: hypothetical protein KatS3mg110_0321 [Pirellulaceae bacterium]
MAGIPFPQLRIGDGITAGALTVFPLFLESRPKVSYQLLEQALSKHQVTVEELGEGGSVPRLRVKNDSEDPVLLLEGQTLVGAKQNRTLNTTVLLKAKSTTTIPVACVEAGRWHYISRHFRTSDRHLNKGLLRVLKASVTRSLKARHGHSCDQGAVWDAIHDLHDRHYTRSVTGDLHDVYDQLAETIAEFRQRLKYIPDACGLAVYLGNKILSLDLFDAAESCGVIWPQLIAGLTLDAATIQDAGQPATAESVLDYWQQLTQWPWEPVDTVGIGQEYRVEVERGDLGTALVYNDALVHLSVLGPSS